MRYVVRDVMVKEVREHFWRRHLGGIGLQANFADISLGFFMLLEGSHEALFLGKERPDLKSGDRVMITIEKSVDARTEQDVGADSGTKP